MRKPSGHLVPKLRNHVASAFIRRHFYVMCPLGRFKQRYQPKIRLRCRINILFDFKGLLIQRSRLLERSEKLDKIKVKRTSCM